MENRTRIGGIAGAGVVCSGASVSIGSGSIAHDGGSSELPNIGKSSPCREFCSCGTKSCFGCFSCFPGIATSGISEFVASVLAVSADALNASNGKSMSPSPPPTSLSACNGLSFAKGGAFLAMS